MCKCLPFVTLFAVKLRSKKKKPKKKQTKNLFLMRFHKECLSSMNIYCILNLF